jgi:hypothetical protein
MLTKKKRQHHVWKTYLKAWEVDGKVTCLTDRRLFATNPINLAVEGGFYEMVRLNNADIAFIRKFVVDAATHPAAKRNHESLLKMLTAPARVVAAHQHNIANVSEVNAALDIFRTNVLEDLHAGAEERFLPLLNRLYAEDISFYNDDRLIIHFLHYICMQHMRTKGIKAEGISAFQVLNGVDLSRTWDIMSQMFAANIGASLYRERRDRKLILLKNPTEIDFVTGDQPTLNLNGKGDRKPLETLVYYYPVSPRIAIILTETDGQPPFTTEPLTSTQIRQLNARMARAAHSQLYARSEDVLLQAQADAADETIVPSPAN